MSKLNGHYYFSKRQITLMLKGKKVTFYRDGQQLIAGMKMKHKKLEIGRLQAKLAKYEAMLKSLGKHK